VQAPDAVGLDPGERIAAEKVALLQRDANPEAGLNGL
jgi:hypothetical protein